MAVRVIIAEDSLIVREGVRLLLEREEGIEVAGVCADLPELLALVDADPPQVVVTDVRMPPTFSDEGIRAATQFRTTHPDVGVVVLSQYAEPAYANELLEGGSAGRAYLLKERVSEPGQLTAAVYAVASGGSVIDPAVVDVIVAASARAKPSPLDSLSDREREVLDQIAQGKSNAAIAGALFLTERAIEKHINALFGKLGLGVEPDVNRRVKAVLMHLSDQQNAGG